MPVNHLVSAIFIAYDFVLPFSLHMIYIAEKLSAIAAFDGPHLLRVIYSYVLSQRLPAKLAKADS